MTSARFASSSPDAGSGAARFGWRTAKRWVDPPVSWQYGAVRIVGSAFLAIAATLIGLFGNLILGAAGLSWAGPGVTVIEYSDSDDTERAIGIGMGTIALVVWLVLLLSALLVGLRGDRPTRERRATVWSVVGLSMVLVLGVLIAVLATPPPLY